MDRESGYQGAGDACAQHCVGLCLPGTFHHAAKRPHPAHGASPILAAIGGWWDTPGVLTEVHAVSAHLAGCPLLFYRS